MLLKVFRKIGLSNLAFSFLKKIYINKKCEYDQTKDYFKELAPLSNSKKGLSYVAKREFKDISFDLSIIVPCYNTGKILEDCLNSILNQRTSFTYEILVINDGSTDQTTLNILNKYASYQNIYVINQNNAGHSGARNTGIEHCRGKYLMFVDSDDLLSLDSVEKLLFAAVQNDADVVEGDYSIVDFNGEEKEIVHHKMSNSLNNTLFGYPWAKVIKREVFNNLCFPLGYWYEDTIVRLLIYKIAAKKMLLDCVVYGYRDNPYGITNNSFKSEKSVDTVLVVKEILTNYRSLNIDVDNEDCEWFFHHMFISFSRIKYLKVKIKKTVFFAFCSLYEQYFKNDKIVKNNKFNKAELCLKQKNFRLFISVVDLY